MLFERSSDDRVIAGVCGGIAARLAVDATLVRLVFAILALAGGAGILVYLALWIYARGRRALPAATLFAVASAAILFALGLSGTALLGATLLVAGPRHCSCGGRVAAPGRLAASARSRVADCGCRDPPRPAGGERRFPGAGAVAGALFLVVGPWVWQLTVERTERIRLEERAEVAARIHDSVLQTLALIQRHAGDSARVATIARRQERELRGWLYGSGVAGADTLVAALVDAAADVEELHGVPIELASAGDAPLDDRTRQLVLAAREAMTNAAKFSGAAEIAVYAEVGAEAVSVFVRDRGSGFDRATVTPDRRGIAESIEGRLERAAGTATIVSAPESGTEVELRLPRRDNETARGAGR